MNWEAVGAVAELVGAIAVVVSLLYVASQVRESTRQARRDATRELASRISDVSLAVATNPELGGLLVTGGADLSRLSPGDQARFRGLMNSLFQTYLLDRGRWYSVSFPECVWGLVGGRPDREGKTIAEQYTTQLEQTEVQGVGQ